ncbi:hypothetical protein A2U01_0112647, partial [Trifolium medium]|nr:hypothetical protein [Trifolium medium]
MTGLVRELAAEIVLWTGVSIITDGDSLLLITGIVRSRVQERWQR